MEVLIQVKVLYWAKLLGCIDVQVKHLALFYKHEFDKGKLTAVAIVNQLGSQFSLTLIVVTRQSISKLVFFILLVHWVDNQQNSAFLISTNIPLTQYHTFFIMFNQKVFTFLQNMGLKSLYQTLEKLFFVTASIEISSNFVEKISAMHYVFNSAIQLTVFDTWGNTLSDVWHLAF